MAETSHGRVLRALLRANPRYDLLLLDRVSQEDRLRVGDATHGGSLYGYLCPQQGSGLQWRSASPDVALLFLTLAEPAPLPSYIRERLGTAVSATIEKLILDGVLEIEVDGRFASGPDSVGTLAADAGEGTVSRMSVEALQYAQALEGLSVDELSRRLYVYGRVPISPTWQRELGDEDAVEEFLGLGTGGAVRRLLNPGWEDVRTSGSLFWRTWVPRRRTSDPNAAVYKLYVSPQVKAVPAVLQALAETLAHTPGVIGFKVGRDIYGLFRPDKLVAYFTGVEALQTTSARLRAALQSTPAHGVPFTAEITRDGLLSWGVDPPNEQRTSSDPFERSWRGWITNRLAEYLVAVKARSSSAESWRFALERLRLDGVDTHTWVPDSRLWSKGSGPGDDAH